MPVPSRNKRDHPRYPANGSFEGSELSGLRSAEKRSGLRGKIENISDGGFSIIAPRVPARSSLLQGRLRFARLPSQIPTLVQVRWTKRVSGHRYVIGLQYVL
jgi:hypothetical protein